MYYCIHIYTNKTQNQFLPYRNVVEMVAKDCVLLIVDCIMYIYVFFLYNNNVSNVCNNYIYIGG